MSRIDGGLWGEISKHVGYHHFQRIESTLTGNGIADVNYLLEGGTEGWIELKKSDHWAVGMRPEQIGWHLRRARLGGRTFIAVRRAPKREDELWLIPGREVSWLAKNGLRTVSTKWRLGREGPKNWDWAAFLEVLGAPKV